MADRAEVLLFGGRFVDPSRSCKPLGNALLARDGKIAFVGAENEARAIAAPSAKCIALEGRTAVPGWVDSHLHLQSLGRLGRQCSLAGPTSREEVLERIATFAAEHPDAAWILGRGYALNDWDDPSYPTARQLDEAIPERPCLLRSFDGHSAWANTPALKLAGLTKCSPDPEGGVILRDALGNPVGYFLEEAVNLLYNALPPETGAEVAESLRIAVEEMVRFGFTGAHVPLGPADVSAWKTRQCLERLHGENGCPLRVRIFSRFEDFDEARREFADTSPANRVSLGGIKLSCDGSLGSRTAWMFEPFRGSNDNCGMPVIDGDELRDKIKSVNEAGMPVICHAIGDRACHETLRAFMDVGNRSIGNRIEHAQILREEDVEVFARAGVAASLNPSHLWTDWRPSDRLLDPQRRRFSFAFRSLLDAGSVVSIGSDAPVVEADPRHALHASVMRTDRHGLPEGGWVPEQRIRPDEWAVAMAYGAWRSIGEDDGRGTLEVGMDCDLTIVREDFLAANFCDYLSLHVDGAVVGGQLTYWRLGGL